MAKFSAELPNELIRQFEDLIGGGADQMMEEMVEEGAKYVYSEVDRNMRRVFKTTRSLEQGLKLAEAKRDPGNDTIFARVEFDGYNDKGIPIPLIALAREYGTSSGEHKKPFFRTAFKRGKITDVMISVQKKYIPED